LRVEPTLRKGTFERAASIDKHYLSKMPLQKAAARCTL
jgi:hypothetical protein